MSSLPDDVSGSNANMDAVSRGVLNGAPHMRAKERGWVTVPISPAKGPISTETRLQRSGMGKAPAVWAQDQDGAWGWAGIGVDVAEGVWRKDPTAPARWDGWGAGVGIPGGLFPGLDIDVNDASVVEQILGWLTRFGRLDVSKVYPRTGRAPRVCVPMRAIEGYRARGWDVDFEVGGTKHTIQLIGRGKQWVAWGVHPGTNKPYEWESGDIGDIDAASLPEVGPEDIEDLHRDLIVFLEDELGAKVVSGHGRVPQTGAISAGVDVSGKVDPALRCPGSVGLSPIECVEKLMAAMPNTGNEPRFQDRKGWVLIAQAIWGAVPDLADRARAEAAFVEWSHRWPGVQAQDAGVEFSKCDPSWRMGWQYLVDMANATGVDLGALGVVGGGLMVRPEEMERLLGGLAGLGSGTRELDRDEQLRIIDAELDENDVLGISVSQPRERWDGGGSEFDLVGLGLDPTRLSPKAVLKGTCAGDVLREAAGAGAGVLPPRPWVHGGMALRGSVSLISAPGGAFKTSVLLAWGVDAAAARQEFAPVYAPGNRARVAYVSAEEDTAELRRKVRAIGKELGLAPEDLDALVLLGSDAMPLRFTRSEGHGRVVLDAEAVGDLMEWVADEGFDIVMLDPLGALFGDTNNNDLVYEFQRVMLRALHRESGRVGRQPAAVVIAHHANKGSGDDEAGQSTSQKRWRVRGASALVDMARVVVYLTPVPTKMLEDYGVPESEHGRFVMLAGVKANYSARKAPTIYRMEWVSLGNGPPPGVTDQPPGDVIPVARPWTPPTRGPLALTGKPLVEALSWFEEAKPTTSSGRGKPNRLPREMVARAWGCSDEDADRVLDRLVAAGVLSRQGVPNARRVPVERWVVDAAPDTWDGLDLGTLSRDGSNPFEDDDMSQDHGPDDDDA